MREQFPDQQALLQSVEKNRDAGRVVTGRLQPKPGQHLCGCRLLAEGEKAEQLLYRLDVCVERGDLLGDLRKRWRCAAKRDEKLGVERLGFDLAGVQRRVGELLRGFGDFFRFRGCPLARRSGATSQRHADQSIRRTPARSGKGGEIRVAV